MQTGRFSIPMLELLFVKELLCKFWQARVFGSARQTEYAKTLSRAIRNFASQSNCVGRVGITL